jgi:NAD(P)-dependent dehydrogenase (short-subunit alcohol dehydrogenase family)
MVRSMAENPSTNPMDLEGSSVLITGGTKGIGRVLVERFLGWGADVMTCGRSEPDDLPTAGGRTARFTAADIRDPDQAAELVDATVSAFGRLDTLVNNAGGSPPADADAASPRFSESIIRLNLLAPLHVSQRANHHMQQAQDGGVIINIGSVSGTRPSPGTAAYGAAKAGLISLTQTLAVEWAPKVRVAGIIAGMIHTEKADLFYGDSESIERVAATVPAGRLGTPDDLAEACRWLASPLASYVSGTSIWLHGGGERPAFLDAADA